jgi:hypothetical protein
VECWHSKKTSLAGFVEAVLVPVRKMAELGKICQIGHAGDIHR